MNGVELFRFECFAGTGGGILGGILDGQRCIGAIEKEPYRRAVLLQRQQDKILPWFPIWDDVTTFRYDNLDCKEYIDSLRSIRDRLIISGGFPCQDISPAGKGAGIDGDRSGLFFEFARIVSEVRPRYWFLENSPTLIIRGFDRVLGTISEMGYNARWGIIGADNAGAPHHRKRLWILAHSRKIRLERSGDRDKTCTKKRNAKPEIKSLLLYNGPPGPREESRIQREVDDVPNRLERLKAIGDGQVPQVASIAWRILSEGLI